MERPDDPHSSTVEHHIRPPPRPGAPPLVPVSTAQRPVPLPRGTADGTVPAGVLPYPIGTHSRTPSAFP
jgi:hypothetical protein